MGELGKGLSLCNLARALLRVGCRPRLLLTLNEEVATMLHPTGGKRTRILSRYLIICRWCGKITSADRRTRNTCSDACKQALCRGAAPDWRGLRDWQAVVWAFENSIRDFSWQIPLLKWLGFVREVSPEVQQRQAKMQARYELRSKMTHSEKCRLGWQERREWLAELSKEWANKWSEYIREGACPSCHLAKPHHSQTCEHYV
jgi:hypothetical protein